MVIGRAMAGLAILRADAMSVLRDLERRPLVFRQSSDQASDNASLAHAPRMPSDHDDCHRYSFFASRANAANCFKYSRTGFAGVPQKATPFPRSTLLGRTPP